MELIEKISTPTTTPTLCLNMIVKNESRIIERLLQSVLPIIDCYCICDTGSTDNTEEIITTFFEKNNIPGKIIKEPFKNFEYNRTFALKSCLGMCDYILLLDADMILQIGNFKKKNLIDYDAYHILQGNEQFYYQNMRIVKNNELLNYSGVTHEYINIPSFFKSSQFNKDELFILDIGDGGAKSDKYERDIKLLLQGIEDVEKLPNKPNYDRYHFYLANSYSDCGNYENAIEYYKKRIELGGWHEEIWYSYYRIGLCYKKMNKIGDAIYYWILGYDFYPNRIENIYEIVNHYRHISKHKLANMYYQIGKQILNKTNESEKNSHLFLHNDIYTYKLDYEYTIFGFYIDVKNINNEIIKILNNSDDQNINNNLIINMKFYKDFLIPIQKIDLTNTYECLVNGENTKFNSSSSCLIPNENTDGYSMNIRYVNYYINEIGNYLNCEKHITTCNKYLELDKHFNIINEKMFDVNFENRQYIGVEDVRIFRDNETKKIIFTGTGFLRNNSIGVVKGVYDVNQEKLIYNDLHCGFNHSDCEKNWVFVDYNNSTHMIYSWCPLKICKVNEEINTLELKETKDMPKIFSHVRGSSCGFKYKKIISTNIENTNFTFIKNELWFIVHLVAYDTPRFYYHMFVVLDEGLNLLRYSAPFKFEDNPIEYSLSVVVEDERVLVNYSGWDRTTKIAVYDKKYIDSIICYK